MAAPLSHEHPLMRDLRGLHRPEGRRQAGAFLVEGRRAIDGFLAAGWHPDLVLIPSGSTTPEGWPTGQTISDRAATRISQASTPSGWFARFPLPGPDPTWDAHRGGLVLVEINDPGNLGTLIRSAAAFGWRQVLVVGGADPYGHKAVQASSGALAAVGLRCDDIAHGLAAVVQGAIRCALVVAGGVPPEVLPKSPRWLVVGGEAHGLPETLLSACDERLTLPMPGGRVESLNAAIAGSIACYLLAP